MWTCHRCSEACEDQFDRCWNCQTERVFSRLQQDADAEMQAAARTEPTISVRKRSAAVAANAKPQPTGSHYRTHVMGRYKDAYIVAGAIDTAGVAIKALGGIAGALLFLVTLVTGSQLSGLQQLMLITVGLLFGCLVGGLAYLLGTLVAAQGQILRASLDGAVNTSPFLNDDERARAMGLV